MTEGLSEVLLALVPVYGAGLLFVITFLSCLALPVPSSLAMLAGGAFAAVGDLSLAAIAGAALVGALLGDQTGYAIGVRGGGVLARMTRRKRAGAMVARAQAELTRRAWSAVFFSRWLVSPLGPWVNLAAGATRLNWARFSSASVAGESVWVVTYVGLGWGFAAQIDQIGAIMGSLSGAVAAAAAAALGLRALWSLAQRRPRR